MKQIYIHATHWSHGEAEEMIPAGNEEKFRLYLKSLLKRDYIITCIRMVET